MANSTKLIAEVKVFGNHLNLISPEAWPIEDGVYSVEIKEIRESKTDKQNRYLWKLIGEISKAQSGDLNDMQTIYNHCLRGSGAKYEVYIMKHEAYEAFKKRWKDCIITKQETINHELYDTVFAFYGSSTFNTKEMSELIDYTLKYAYEQGVCNIESYWKGLLYDND